jgi:hypothetical protein
LIAGGLEYLTDDVCAIDLTSGCARPYPKPIGIAAETTALFAGARAASPAGAARFVDDDAFLTPADLGARAATGVSRPRVVVVPDYRAGTATDLQPLSRAETAVLLAEQSFNFDALRAPALFLIGDVLRECACYRMTYSDLTSGVATVCDLLAGIAEPSR